ncbi:DMT family transporter [Pseudovibrio flavus]|uniref:DMT family transporter n=1 Tax=Pseudovibrio flavus TaxID=2529854 RepID=UPI00211C7F99|nr:DMT family transporter [Pseudovibrio flavus]
MSTLTRIAPILFVLLWSTGFIGAKLGAPYSDPFPFLSIRFLIVIPLFAVLIALAGGSLYLPRKQIALSIFVGTLIHGTYLGGVFWAIDRGMPAGASTAILGLQPVLTAMMAYLLLKEPVRLRQWAGLVLGLFGLMAVVLPRLNVEDATGIPAITIPAIILAVLGISLGTVVQKKMPVGASLLTVTFYQYIGALLVTLPLSFTESWTVVWAPEFIIAILWLVLVLSVGAVLLLLLLIREGAVASTASLFYLVPVATSIESYFLFSETLTVVQMVGMLVMVVAIIMSRPKQQAR